MYVITAAAIAYIIFMKAGGYAVVSGNSMNPTFTDGDFIRCQTKFSADELHDGDIITFRRGRKPYIKRIIGCPGDTVTVSDGYFLVNGESVYEESARDKMENPGLASQGISLGSGEYFCVGDNRNHSLDSRNIGPIRFDEITGIVIGKSEISSLLH